VAARLPDRDVQTGTARFAAGGLADNPANISADIADEAVWPARGHIVHNLAGNTVAELCSAGDVHTLNSRTGNRPDSYILAGRYMAASGFAERLRSGDIPAVHLAAGKAAEDNLFGAYSPNPIVCFLRRRTLQKKAQTDEYSAAMDCRSELHVAVFLRCACCFYRAYRYKIRKQPVQDRE